MKETSAEILDCTLRDGGHAIGGAFSPAATAHFIKRLLAAGVKVIECGKPSGKKGREKLALCARAAEMLNNSPQQVH